MRSRLLRCVAGAPSSPRDGVLNSAGRERHRFRFGPSAGSFRGACSLTQAVRSSQRSAAGERTRFRKAMRLAFPDQRENTPGQIRQGRYREVFMSSDGKTGLQLRSLIKKSGELEISLASVPTPEPGPDEIVVRVEASPINPSDLGLLVGAADMTTAKACGTEDAPLITAKVPEAAVKAMAGRIDGVMPGGHEEAGVVVQTGSHE